MSAKAIENGEEFATDALLQESQSDEEEEPSQLSSAGSTSGGPPPGPPSGPPTGSDEPGTDSTDLPKGRGRTFSRIAVMAAAAVTGGVLALGAVSVVPGTMGFTSTRIAASSPAAKMMSAATIANGGGVSAGSLVATLQSVGAVGLSTSSNVLLGLTGSSIGAWLGNKEGDPLPSPSGPKTKAKRAPHGGGDPEDGSPPNDKPPASQNGSEKDEK